MVDSTDNLRGMLGNLAFSLSLYSGQMCTTPQNLYVPRDGIDTDEGHLSFEEFGERLGRGGRAGSPATTPRRSSCSAPRSTTGCAPTPRGLAALAEEAGGTVVLDSPQRQPPGLPRRGGARARVWSRVDVAARTSTPRSASGRSTFLIGTASTEQSLAQFRDTVREHGAMTAAVYSTSEDVLDAARDAAADGGVALSENLTGQVFVNQTAAFSDYHGTGANPAANAGLHRRGVRRQPLPGGHRPPSRLRRLSPGTQRPAGARAKSGRGAGRSATMTP